MRHLCFILIFIQGSIISSNGLYECNETEWYDSYSSNATVTLQQNNASFCYGVFSGGTGTVFDAAKECALYRAYLASAYNDRELNFVSEFLSLLVQNGTQLRYPIWIGLQRNLTNSSLHFWNDTCENKSYPGLVPNDLPSNILSGNVYGLLSTMNYQNVITTAPFYSYICRRDENRCGSNPCLNNATCRNVNNCFKCICFDGFTGQYCEITAETSSTTVSASTVAAVSLSTIGVSKVGQQSKSNSVSAIYKYASTNNGLQVAVQSLLSGNLPHQPPPVIVAVSNLTTIGSTTSKTGMFSNSSGNVLSSSNTSTIGLTNSEHLGSTNLRSDYITNTDLYSFSTMNTGLNSYSKNNIDSNSDSITSPQSLQTKSFQIRYLYSNSANVKQITTAYEQFQVFNGGGLPQWVWFTFGFVALIAFLALMGITCFICGSQNKPKSIPFT